MAIRYKREEETIADVLKASRRSERNANRPTGTEVNQTAQTVIEMVPVVADALEKSQKAIDDAADAVTTSSGKNARRRGQTEPEPPPGGWTPGDQWVVDNEDGVPFAVEVWNGTEFVPEQLLAAELLVLSSGGVIRLADGTVTADAIAADAIDGMLITGATIRTAPTGQRMQFDISGLVSYDSTGAQTSRIYSGSGGMELLGGLSLAYSGDDRTGSISPGGVGFSNPDPAGDQLSGLSSASLIINRGNVNTTPTGFNLELDHEGLFYRYKGSSGSQRDLEAFIGRSLSLDSVGENYTYVQADESRTVRTRTDEVSPRSGESVTVRAASAFATPEIRVDASVGSGVIHLDAPKVTFQRVVNPSGVFTIDSPGGVSVGSYAQIKSTTQQNVVTASNVVVVMQDEQINNGDFTLTASTIEIGHTGRYKITSRIVFERTASGQGGTYELYLQINQSAASFAAGNAAAAADMSLETPGCVFNLNAGDSIRVVARQGTGATRQITGAAHRFAYLLVEEI